MVGSEPDETGLKPDQTSFLQISFEVRMLTEKKKQGSQNLPSLGNIFGRATFCTLAVVVVVVIVIVVVIVVVVVVALVLIGFPPKPL